MQIKSLYMPDSIIQNDEFPAHVIWDKNDNVEITVSVPDHVKIKEIFNIVEDSVEKIDEKSVRIKDFEVNGYVGFVFETQLLEQPESFMCIKFNIQDLKTLKKKTFIKKIKLFRPSIEVIKVPSQITINYDDKTKKCEIDNKIHFSNTGEGTALVTVKLASENDFEITIPDGVSDFVKKFISDLEIEFKLLKSEYSEYSDIIDKFFSMLKKPISFEKDNISKVQAIESELSDIFENNEDFLEGFIFAIWTSYIKNIQLMTQIESFMNYLNSIGNNKIILANAIDLLKPNNPTGDLKISVQITDLNYNEYPPIEIPKITIICNDKCKIPIHSLFDWNEKLDRGE